MPIAVELNKERADNLIKITVWGRLTKEDYALFLPKMEEVIRERGEIRILLVMRDFHGWDAGAAWQDLKFDRKHFSDIDRVAIVGDQRWESWMANLFKLFTRAKVRYFEAEHLAEAQEWLCEPAHV